MPDESCRKCGGVLLEYAVCGNCRKPIQLMCRICAQKTLQKYHEGFCFHATPITKLEMLVSLS